MSGSIGTAAVTEIRIPDFRDIFIDADGAAEFVFADFAPAQSPENRLIFFLAKRAANLYNGVSLKVAFAERVFQAAR